MNTYRHQKLVVWCFFRPNSIHLERYYHFWSVIITYFLSRLDSFKSNSNRLHNNKRSFDRFIMSHPQWVREGRWWCTKRNVVNTVTLKPLKRDLNTLNLSSDYWRRRTREKRHLRKRNFNSKILYDNDYRRRTWIRVGTLQGLEHYTDREFFYNDDDLSVLGNYNYIIKVLSVTDKIL